MLLKPLDDRTAQMGATVKAAQRGASRCLDGGGQMCYSGSSETLLSLSNVNQFGWNFGFHKCSQ